MCLLNLYSTTIIHNLLFKTYTNKVDWYVTTQVVNNSHYLIEKRGVDEGAGMPVTVSTPHPKLNFFKYTKPELNAPFTVSSVVSSQ